jgi:hypothetical protein
MYLNLLDYTPLKIRTGWVGWLMVLQLAQLDLVIEDLNTSKNLSNKPQHLKTSYFESK